MWVRTLGQEDPLEQGTAGTITHSSILAWRIPWTEEPAQATVCRVVESNRRDLAQHGGSQDAKSTAKSAVKYLEDIQIEKIVETWIQNSILLVTGSSNNDFIKVNTPPRSAGWSVLNGILPRDHTEKTKQK